MSNITISVPITKEQERFIKERVKSGVSANRAHVVRQALNRLSEEEAVNAVLEAEQEIVEGKGLRGDLRELLKKIR
ncbi:MAG: hypothetical protein COV96_00605 [Candidatus Zambryskibacteria bacterium CG11_big_fil_rev_8_21_14_0_20_42_18]|uniref:Ribbon-helix-helix protein CopG domain-containing protein n=1 Tax=Candidatus Zambryskibacteria bacterium CG_4_9_14_3_um_filter_42_15 TaxID=1975112 RepID=A0A2M7WSM2_9BACT|nr:MAG: hypothetical protein COV96_00605 [Candidatus Zambryskibacteria bacterium CG11_big_fil_rev_8_21_14_0_20_42_18]PJA33010.1 MAG: hypothetical protein CO185_00830 [Candidatus Zambryskibacteria bacterium CG_4_9_14_3_um_filter_42_15]